MNAILGREAELTGLTAQKEGDVAKAIEERSKDGDDQRKLKEKEQR